MSNRRLIIIALSSVALVALIVALSLALSASHRRAIDFALPEFGEPAVTSDVGANFAMLSLVDVNRETVQDVIATLRRPTEYSRDVRVESFWSGGSVAYNFSTAFSGGRVSLRTTSGTKKNVVIQDGTVYVWYDGDTRVYSAPVADTAVTDAAVADTASADAIADEYEMLLTYEDVLALAPYSILAANVTTATPDGDSSIYVRYQSGELGYVTECHISVRLGLLTDATIYDGETIIYTMTAGDCTLAPADETLFVVPGLTTT
jgi:hypothetical protein